MLRTAAFCKQQGRLMNCFVFASAADSDCARRLLGPPLLFFSAGTKLSTVKGFQTWPHFSTSGRPLLEYD